MLINIKQIKNKIYNDYKYIGILSLSVISIIGTNQIITFADTIVPKDAYTVLENNIPVATILENEGITESFIVAEVENTIKNNINKDIQIKNDLSLVSTKARKNEISDLDDVINSLSKTNNYNIMAYNLSINDNHIAYSENLEDITSTLKDIESAYKTENSVHSKIIDNVEISEEYIDAKELKTSEDLTNILTSNKLSPIEYTIQENDTLYSISQNNNIDISTLMAENNLSSDSVLKIGNTLKLPESIPYISVKTKDIISYDTTVESPIEYIENPNEYITFEKIIESGSSGVKNVTAEIVKINGNEINRNILSEILITEPTTTKIEVGTSNVIPKKATGVFLNPSTNGVLNSEFGYRIHPITGRSTLHTGIDLSVPYGSNVFASDGGVIEYSGWMSGYGYLIIIDHENGYKTYYAHNSSLVKKVGERIAPGDIIAKAGSTGNSTGTHVHFEVRINDIPQNPLDYINY